MKCLLPFLKVDENRTRERKKSRVRNELERETHFRWLSEMKKERNEKNSNGVRLEEADLFKLDKNRRRCPDRFLSQKKTRRK